MSYDYATFVSTIETMAVINPSTDSEFVSMIPRMIEAAELRCYRDVDFMITRKYAQSTFQAIGTVGAAAQLLAAPTDMVIPRTLAYFTPVGTTTTRAFLERRQENYLQDYNATPGTGGAPKFWAMTTFGTLIIAPTPDQAYTTELAYTYRPAPLSATNTTTWLATWCPDLMLYAALVFISGYQKNFGAAVDDPKMAVTWEGQYQQALRTSVTEEERRKASGYADFGPSMTPSTNAN